MPAALRGVQKANDPGGNLYVPRATGLCFPQPAKAFPEGTLSRCDDARRIKWKRNFRDIKHKPEPSGEPTRVGDRNQVPAEGPQKRIYLEIRETGAGGWMISCVTMSGRYTVKPVELRAEKDKPFCRRIEVGRKAID